MPDENCMSCSGRTAIVTGAAGSGMGRSIALTLAREGARIVVNYRTSSREAEAVVAHIERRGGSAVAVQADITKEAQCKTLVDAAIESCGQVDICIIGPGAGWHQEPIAELNAAAALEDVEKELAPLYHLMPLVLPGMYARKWGRLIATSLLPPCDSPAYAYNVAKAARSEAMRIACGEAWTNGVTINTIAPGPVSAIESLELAIEHCDHGPAWQDRQNTSPQDIAEGVAFLCSEKGSFISGAVLPFRYH